MIKKSPRHSLFIWGVVEILLAIGLLFVWSTETGILYWVRGLIFSILFLTGLLAIKDGFFASDTDIFKKTHGGNRDNFELKTKNSFLSKLKKLNDKCPGVFAVATALFMIIYLGNISIPGKEIVEGTLLVIIIILGIPVIVFW